MLVNYSSGESSPSSASSSPSSSSSPSNSSSMSSSKSSSSSSSSASSSTSPSSLSAPSSSSSVSVSSSLLSSSSSSFRRWPHRLVVIRNYRRKTLCRVLHFQSPRRFQTLSMHASCSTIAIPAHLSGSKSRSGRGHRRGEWDSSRLFLLSRRKLAGIGRICAFHPFALADLFRREHTLACRHTSTTIDRTFSDPRMQLGANGVRFVRQQNERLFGFLRELKQLVGARRELQLAHSAGKLAVCVTVLFVGLFGGVLANCLGENEAPSSRRLFGTFNREFTTMR